jgi:pimeloyl-ACP methyl ester carboxylesterase
MTDPRRPSWVDDELFPFESRFVAIDGHTIHYVDEGSGPTLLFLHGNPHVVVRVSRRHPRPARRVSLHRNGLPRIRALVVWGDADIASGNAELWRWEQIFTDHHSVIVEGAGHFVQSDAPVRFASDPRLGRSRLTGAVATDCRSTNRRQWCCATRRPPARRAEPRRP